MDKYKFTLKKDPNISVVVDESFAPLDVDSFEKWIQNPHDLSDATGDMCYMVECRNCKLNHRLIGADYILCSSHKWHIEKVRGVKVRVKL